MIRITIRVTMTPIHLLSNGTYSNYYDPYSITMTDQSADKSRLSSR